jgi:hypothetical protein
MVKKRHLLAQLEVSRYATTTATATDVTIREKEIEILFFSEGMTKNFEFEFKTYYCYVMISNKLRKIDKRLKDRRDSVDIDFSDGIRESS